MNIPMYVLYEHEIILCHPKLWFLLFYRIAYACVCELHATLAVLKLESDVTCGER
jgi:hypothetical protein